MPFKLKPHQVVLTVTDINRSINFYTQFGFRVGQKMNKEDGRKRVTLISDQCPDYELKLFTNKEPKPITPAFDFADYDELQEYLTTLGIRYMSLLCDDVNGFYEHWKGEVKFVSPPKTGMTGCRYSFFVDPDGILVEIYQRGYESSV